MFKEVTPFVSRPCHSSRLTVFHVPLAITDLPGGYAEDWNRFALEVLP
jgi:hypothetical protein